MAPQQQYCLGLSVLGRAWVVLTLTLSLRQ